MGLISDLICGMLAIPFFLLGIVFRGLEILIEEMAKSASRILSYFLIVLVLAAAGMWNLQAFQESFMEFLSRAARTAIVLAIAFHLRRPINNIFLGVMQLILCIQKAICKGFADISFKIHETMLGSMLKRS